jgi:hypothetical protein
MVAPVSQSAAKEQPVGERRVDLAAMMREQNVLASLHWVEGRWMPLGEMRPADCAAAAANYLRLSRHAQAKAEALGKIRDALKPGKTVAQSLGEEGVIRLFGGVTGARELLIPKVNNGDH